MAQNVYSQPSSTRKGLPSIFEYVNDDGNSPINCCGQAAMATLLTKKGLQKTASASTNVKTLEAQFPPDIAWGYFGTSKQRMEQMITAHGRLMQTHLGHNQLKSRVSAGKPVAVMLDVSKGMAGSPSAQGLAGHWMVVFAFDNKWVYTTNFGGVYRRIDWARFDRGWNSWMPAAIGMHQAAISVA
jgi:hypothetical protein